MPYLMNNENNFCNYFMLDCNSINLIDKFPENYKLNFNNSNELSNFKANELNYEILGK